MSDRSPFTLTVRTRDVEAAKRATGLSFEDETEEGAATHLMDPEVAGGGESLLDALREAGIPFTAQGDPHYTYNGYVAVFDGRDLMQQDCGLNGVSELLFDPTKDLVDQQVMTLIAFSRAHAKVEAALVSGEPLAPPRADLDQALVALGKAIGPLEQAEALGNPHDYPPYYAHDCTDCVYLGHASGTHDNLPVDLYLCRRTLAPELERFGSVIARFGPAGAYLSYPGFVETELAAYRNPLTREALARARDRGLLGPYNAASLTCGELLRLADQGSAVFPIQVGAFRIHKKEVNLLTVERNDRSLFYVREYELVPDTTNAAHRLLVLSMEAPR